ERQRSRCPLIGPAGFGRAHVRRPRRGQLRGGARRQRARRTFCTLSPQPRAPTKQMPPYRPRKLPPSARQAAEKGAAARRRPKAAGEAYFLYVEPAAEGANEADAPLSAA